MTTEITLRGPDGETKPLWQENWIGRTIRRRFGKSVRNRLFGKLSDRLLSSNSITNAGHVAANGRISNQGGYSPFVNLAIGIGTQGTPATSTTLASEITTNGGGRGAATASQVTTSVTNDTMQLVLVWTFSGSFAVTEECILDNATSGGTMLAYQSFSAVNVVSGDQLTITHKVQT